MPKNKYLIITVDAIFIPDENTEEFETVEKAFKLMPEIAEAYKANGWEMGVFYLNDATAEIRNMFAIEESYEFKY